MARFPVVQSPCPYKANLAAVMEGDQCRMCQREVHDITAMSDAERDAFLAACSGEVCVKYEFRMPRRAAALALGAAAVAMPLPLAAQDAPVPDEAYEEIEILVGGLTHLDKVEFIEDASDKKRPDLPVEYEEAPALPAGQPAA
jgi:predicted Fe-S protein YdhL (DUF1289 family)